MKNNWLPRKNACKRSRRATGGERTTKTEFQYKTFPEYFAALSEQYQNLPPEAVSSAFSRTAYGSAFMNNPQVQNRRVKNISSLPVNYGRGEVAEMLRKPDESEKQLRQVSQALESTAYPYRKIRKTYQDIMTYRNYIYPVWVEKDEAGKPEFTREWRLVEKLRKAIKPEQHAHEIVGQCIRDGKVFYAPRLDVDKSHNSVPHAFMQQLPQDWSKIVGFNNVSGYTIAFDMMYFMQPGTDWRQYGDLFEPYMDIFGQVASVAESGGARKANRAKIDIVTFQKLSKSAGGALAGEPEVYGEGSLNYGRWFYYVTLPPGKVWTFEVDDVSRNVCTPLSGLFLSMTDIADYEAVQLSLVQNPLVSVLVGEIPYMDNATPGQSDPYKLGPAGRAYFEALWYQMLSANNTSGIGLYAAPLANMKLQQLTEAPNATKVSTAGYTYAMQKAGIGIIPVTDDPRVGTVNVSASLESRYSQGVYRNFENMMNYLLEGLNTRWEWKFVMFGDIFSENDELKLMQSSMEKGILSDLFRYNAILGRSVLDDISMSRAIDATGVLDLRKPLITSYSAKQENSGLPPSVGGRPPVEDGSIATEGREQDADAGD
ncbi:MAG: hypothetical protein RR235_05030 [Oscillospiraceae bacterium]